MCTAGGYLWSTRGFSIGYDTVWNRVVDTHQEFESICDVTLARKVTTMEVSVHVVVFTGIAIGLGWGTSVVADDAENAKRAEKRRAESGVAKQEIGRAHV